MDHTWWDDYGSLVWCVLTIKSSPWWVCRRRKKIGGMIMDHDQGSRLVWCILTIKSSPCWWVCRRRRKTIGGIITKDHDWYDVYGGLRRSTLVTEACLSVTVPPNNARPSSPTMLYDHEDHDNHVADDIYFYVYTITITIIIIGIASHNKGAWEMISLR